jgi:hypothetical protein
MHPLIQPSGPSWGPLSLAIDYDQQYRYCAVSISLHLLLRNLSIYLLITLVMQRVILLRPVTVGYWAAAYWAAGYRRSCNGADVQIHTVTEMLIRILGG